MIEHLNWRYATKHYDVTKKVSDKDLNTLKEAIRLTPTSYGLQGFKLFVIENPAVRASLREKSYGQPQITDASHLFVFVAQNDMTNEHVESYLQLISETRGMAVEELSGFGDYMKGAIGYMTAEQKAVWNSKQAYLGLGILLAAAATLKIDATPMEGFDPAGYNEILGLTDYHTVVAAAVGYRSSEDATQHYPKVRKALEAFVETV